MAKELRMSASLPLPADAFEQANLLKKIEPARRVFEEALQKALSGDQALAVEARIVNSVIRGGPKLSVAEAQTATTTTAELIPEPPIPAGTVPLPTPVAVPAQEPEADAAHPPKPEAHARPGHARAA